ncbi:30S ribosomal protein S17 [Methyloparacoccus murrellii]
MSSELKNVHTLTGTVVSDKMEKTVAVRVDRMVAHPLYGKYIRRSTKVLAHDENNEAKVGDVVVVAACRPVSAKKVWKLDRILERSR